MVSKILEYKQKFLQTGYSDLLGEVIPESIKNMVLVLDNAGLLRERPSLFELISTRLSGFLPELLEIVTNPPNPIE